MHVTGYLLGLLAAYGFSSGAEATCKDRRGLQGAIYPNPEGPNTDQTYSAFDPTVFKTQSPAYQYNPTALAQKPLRSLASRTLGSTEYFAGNFKGYIKSQTTGTYTLTVAGIDEIVLFWVGSNAYSGWTRDNADAVAAYNYDGHTRGKATFGFQLTAGEYTPIRLVYANAQGSSAFKVNILDPTGEVVIGQTPTSSSKVVQFACSPASNAPAFSAFGDES